jgi:hypothetical protein
MRPQSILLVLLGVTARLGAQTVPPCVPVPFSSVLRCPGSTPATTAKPPVVPLDSKLYITPTEGNLHGFIAAEVLKQKLSLVVTTDEKEASFVLTGMSVPADNKWFNSIFGGKDKNEGNLQLINVSTKQLVWAGEAGDRSLFFSQYQRGGLRKVASRLVYRMKKDLAKTPVTIETRARVPGQPALTSLDVLKLKRAGASDDLIINRIKASNANFQLGADDLVALKDLGLSDAVMTAMISR